MTTLASPVEGLISVEEAARIMDVTPAYVRRLAQAGRLAGNKVAKEWLFRRSTVEAFDRQRVPDGRSHARRAPASAG